LLFGERMTLIQKLLKHPYSTAFLPPQPAARYAARL
jgi:hypothetical protein